jgi:hypothetical protein
MNRHYYAVLGLAMAATLVFAASAIGSTMVAAQNNSSTVRLAIYLAVYFFMETMQIPLNNFSNHRDCVEKGRKGHIIATTAAAVVAAVAVAAIAGIAIAGIIFRFADNSGGEEGEGTPPPDDGTTTVAEDNNSGDNSNSTKINVASSEIPKMMLVVLQGDEDSSSAAVWYEENNTEPIQLARNDHIRFDSPGHRTAEGMRVLARDLDNGNIERLRKSYDVNNEFFINLNRGNYELQVQASWFEVGSYVYKFNVAVV